MNNKKKLLFTPGPITTSSTIKTAMIRDMGSREPEFINCVAKIRNDLLSLAELNSDEYTAILLPGSGTFGVEAVLSSVTPPSGKWLVIINGAYGRRILDILKIHNISTVTLEQDENILLDVDQVETMLLHDTHITHIAIVHCETSSGMINNINLIGALAKKYNKTFFVDAMSSFGAVPINFNKANIDFLVTSTNKCLESVPGCSIIFAKCASLQATHGYAKTFALDLYSQWQYFLTTGEFRFTPPVQVLLALQQALHELQCEGGIKKRFARYTQNQKCLVEGMYQLGFKTYLPPMLQGCIITSFHYFDHVKFDFSCFYQQLYEKGHVIYPGKLLKENCFRIGNIGDIGIQEITTLLESIKHTLGVMGIGIVIMTES